MSHAVLQVRDCAEGHTRRRSRPPCRPRAARAYHPGRCGGERGGLRAGSPVGAGAERRSRSEPPPSVSERGPRLLPQSRLRLQRSGGLERVRSNHAWQRERRDGRRGGVALRHPDPRVPPPRRHPGRGQPGAHAPREAQNLHPHPPARPRSGLPGDRRALDRGEHGPVGREDGEGKPHHARGAGRLGAAEPPACRRGHRRWPGHRRNRAVVPGPVAGARHPSGQRHPARHVARADGEAQARVRPSLRHGDGREFLAAHRWCLGGPAHERRRGAGARVHAAGVHPGVRGRGGRSRLATAASPDLRGAEGARARRDRVAGSGSRGGAGSVRGPGALELPGLGRQGLGGQRGSHQRDGRLDSDRASVRRNRRPRRHHARQRDGPPRCAVRVAVDLRAGRHGLRDGAGAPLMPGSALTWELVDGIAVVALDLKGEPVNKISRAVKNDFLGTFESLERERAVQAVAFFSGKPDNFIAGADIEEFVALTTAAEAERLVADGQELLERVARFPKPVAVGIHGACLGGGLEFALACHYRVASDHPKTQLGLPEVQLGILPGAGGCQRLPRLIGARAALDIILAGKSERAPKAFRLGMVDELVHPAILQDITVAAARRLADGWRPRRRRRGGVLGWLLDGNPLGRRLVFRAARRQVLERTKGHYAAPLAALEAVDHGLKHGMAEGLKREARLFGQLAVTDVSRKLVQIFFATTQLKKDFGIPNAPPPTIVQRLAIVGAGFMGSGIAGTAIVQAAVDVRMKDADLPRVAKGLAAARAQLDDRLRRRRITKYEYARLAALLSGGDGYAGFGRADLVIEAGFEDLGVKQRVLRDVEAAARDDAVFASNTSTIPIVRIAEAASRPERVIGMHFFSPVDRMPLLEVIPAPGTAPGVVSTAVGFGRRLGKTVIVVKDSPGFWVNRILAPYANEVGHLLAEGASIEEVDAAAVGFGFPVGPVTLLDEVGLDVAEKVSEVMGAAFGERLQATARVAALAEAGPPWAGPDWWRS